MNRADQAPEPSMEELLASIRLIIADSNKGSPHPKEERASYAAAGGTPGQSGPQSPPASEDVFDLTEEFVFPEDQTAALPEPQAQEIPISAAPPLENSAAGRPAPAGEHVPEPTRRPASPDRPANSRAARQDTRAQPLSPEFRPVWSRREMPSAAAQYQAPSSRPRPDAGTTKPPARNWAEDIQMPVPDQGPVSLIGGGSERPRRQEPQPGIDGTDARAGPAASDPGWDRDDEAAAVAALAQKLARTAMEAMGSQELKSAQEVDFQHLNAESKADVSEKLADAIERESTVPGNPPLPSLLDEVFRHDFIRHSEASEIEAAAAEDEPGAPPAMASNEEASQTEDSTGMQHSVPAAQAASGLTEGAAAPSAAALPAAIQHPAQALFIGPAPIPGGQTLEGAVRDMLRPLLVQWLNENMPRILENAIREEIASRGVFPKPE